MKTAEEWLADNYSRIHSPNIGRYTIYGIEAIQADALREPMEQLRRIQNALGAAAGDDLVAVIEFIIRERDEAVKIFDQQAKSEGYSPERIAEYHAAIRKQREQNTE